MSVTPSFKSNPNIFRSFGVAGAVLIAAVPLAWSQAVPSQANIDASAQRRLQETSREAQRQHRIENQIRNLSPALSSEKLAGPVGPTLARKALAALVRLREEGISVDDAITRATRSAEVGSAQAAKPASYLRNLFMQNSGKITDPILEKLEAGEDPSPDLFLSPFQP